MIVLLSFHALRELFYNFAALLHKKIKNNFL